MKFIITNKPERWVSCQKREIWFVDLGNNDYRLVVAGGPAEAMILAKLDCDTAPRDRRSHVELAVDSGGKIILFFTNGDRILYSRETLKKREVGVIAQYDMEFGRWICDL